MAELEFIVPGKGKPKGTARGTTSTGVHYTPAPTRNAEALVKMAAAQALGNRPPLRGALHLTLVAVFPVPVSWPRWKRELALQGKILPTVKPDMSNILKLLEDGLNTIAYADDKAITDHTLQKRYGERAETWVHFREIYSAELLDRLEGAPTRVAA